MKEKVILVDEFDKEIGEEEKLKAHKDAKLHRAISVFVFNSKGEFLIQKRADVKYHCPGLWSNTCCSHPRPGESVSKAAHRRIQEEMGFICDLKEEFSFLYNEDCGNGLTEHEFDYIFTGLFDGKVNPNPLEVSDYKWISLESLEKDIENNPKKYTPWFKILIKDYKNKFTSFYKN